MLEIKIRAEKVSLAGDLQCACRHECGGHPDEICRDPVDLLLDMGRGMILAVCAECGKQAVQKMLEKLFT